MLLEVRARMVEVAMKPMLTTRVITFSCSSLGVFFSAPCQMSRVRTVDMVISPQSMVDMTAASTAAIIRAHTTAGSSLRITLKKALLPAALYLNAP